MIMMMMIIMIAMMIVILIIMIAIMIVILTIRIAKIILITLVFSDDQYQYGPHDCDDDYYQHNHPAEAFSVNIFIILVINILVMTLIVFISSPLFYNFDRDHQSRAFQTLGMEVLPIILILVNVMIIIVVLSSV